MKLGLIEARCADGKKQCVVALLQFLVIPTLSATVADLFSETIYTHMRNSHNTISESLHQ